MKFHRLFTDFGDISAISSDNSDIERHRRLFNDITDRNFFPPLSLSVVGDTRHYRRHLDDFFDFFFLGPDIVSFVETDILPVGFEDEIKGRGLIVTWCCQIEVISHPAIGGFITHCGWNSILESIWFRIPLLAYPLLTDQFTNRKLVVDDWKIGINLVDNKPITREEVSEKINRLMRGQSRGELRKNIEEARNTLENALSHTGSSANNFSQFVSEVNVKIQKRRGLLVI